MRLKTLYLHQFRNYHDSEISFSPGVNMIIGDNAQGKTNLLEAIYLLITGRSFRTRHLRDLIRFGADAFYLEARFEKNGVEQVLKISFDGEGRKVYHNATQIPSLSRLLGILNGVILSPEDRELIKGGPGIRRQFLDMQISQVNPLYLYHLSRYFGAMKHRNHLLRHRMLKTVEPFEMQMAESAAYLTSERHRATKDIEALLEEDFDRVKLIYKSSGSTSEDFLAQYAKHRSRECEMGKTMIGPHRDNLEIFIDEREARFFSSEGQQRYCATALRLAEWLRLKMVIDELPLMCIDDVGISLDQQREKRLYQKFGDLGQVFLTSPRLKESHGQVIHVQSGRLELVQEDKQLQLAP